LEYEKKKEKEDKKNLFNMYLANKKIWFNSFKSKRDAIRGFREEDPVVKSGKY
jgi:hypothetical protein